MGGWLTCYVTEPCYLVREKKVLLCVVPGMEASELVEDAVGRTKAITPVVEDASSASFAYGVK